MYSYSDGDPIPQTDEDALKWFEGYPEESHKLYLCYRGMGMGVQESLRKTLEACVPKTLKAEK